MATIRLLSLPDTIQFSNGNQIVHVYDASGKRLQTTYYTRKVALVEPATSTLPGSVTNNTQLYTITSQTDVGNKRYKRYGTIGSWQLDYVFNPVGYLRFYAPGEHYPFYYIKDHIGNIRETYITPTPREKYCEQRMQYYPSGLPWNQNSRASEQPFKYNGKEFIEMSGLDEYDSEARWYYPAIMRTTTMDPLCEKYYSISPYAWCGNNPVMFVDPDGKDWYYTIDSLNQRQYVYDSQVFSQDDIDKASINGTYAGITTTYNGTYYGLFGAQYSDNNDKIFAKIMDNFFIQDAKYSQEGEIYHMKFVVPGMNKGKTLEFHYAGGKVIYTQVEENRLHLEEWGDYYKNCTDWMTKRGFSGYIISFLNDKGYDPLNIIFKDKELHDKIYDLYLQTLYYRSTW